MTTRDPRLYVWKGMIQRCTNPNNPQWARYGGRGITVCARWRRFAAFCEDMGPRPAGLTLERIDNDGPYAPGNCRWATRHEQSCNRADSRRITYQGETLNLVEWERRKGLPSGTLHGRIFELGWSVGRAMETPSDMRFRRSRIPHVSPATV